MIINKEINQLDSMYPAYSYMLTTKNGFNPSYDTNWASIYGYSFGDNKITVNGRTHVLTKGQYFSFFVGSSQLKFDIESNLFLVVRLGYKCQDNTGWIEKQGRLSYIDGCTDSLLIYPPRMGDPSLNLLYFPQGIEQSRHLHPSIRFGCVVNGKGCSDVWNNGQLVSNDLIEGTSFCIEENELHRFKTDKSPMTVVAWHPDGDWGPTDHNHTMLNRTYIK